VLPKTAGVFGLELDMRVCKTRPPRPVHPKATDDLAASSRVAASSVEDASNEECQNPKRVELTFDELLKSSGFFPKQSTCPNC
jgi:hypothetical protein